MGYAFLNTKLKERSQVLPIERLKMLSNGASKGQILSTLEQFGIKGINYSLQDANYALNTYFLSEMAKISSITRASPFMYLLTKRFEIEEIMDFVTNFNSSKISSRLATRNVPVGFEAVHSLNEAINAFNMKFRFNLNQNTTVGDLRDKILLHYLNKLVSLSIGDARLLIKKEKFLVNAFHMENYTSFLAENKDKRFYSVLGGDINIVDLRAIFYLYNLSGNLSIKDPLGESVLINYVYHMILNYKLLKALYFSVKKGIRLDFEGIWET